MGMGLGGLGARSGHTADDEIANMMMMDVDSESRRGASFAGEGKGRKMKYVSSFVWLVLLHLFFLSSSYYQKTNLADSLTSQPG